MSGSGAVWRLVKPIVFVACLGPAAWLVAAAMTGGLGVNPIETVTHETGVWTLRLLLVTLVVTPLVRVTGQGRLIQLRRLLGLFAFFYGTLHFLTYLWLDQFFSWPDITKDVVKRPFITAGFTAFVALVPLALTSTHGWVKRLGGRRWQRLHRLIYVSSAAAVVHYLWLVKIDTRRPLAYGAVLATLLAYRAWIRRPRILRHRAHALAADSSAR